MLAKNTRGKKTYKKETWGNSIQHSMKLVHLGEYWIWVILHPSPTNYWFRILNFLGALDPLVDLVRSEPNLIM